jgi:hypothetical protein
VTVNPALRVETDGAATDKLVALCLSHPLPDHITQPEPGVYLVDLPPDVKVLVHVHTAPNLLLRTPAAYTIWTYRNDHDRAAGYKALTETGAIG